MHALIVVHARRKGEVRMFKEVLQEVVDGTQGGVAGLLMGFDGIAVEQYLRDGTESDVESVGIEYGAILKDIRRAAEMLQVGETQEVAVRAERMTTLIRPVNDQFFVAITLAPTGNLGKARFLLRTREAQFRSGLE